MHPRLQTVYKKQAVTQFETWAFKENHVLKATICVFAEELYLLKLEGKVLCAQF